LKIKTDSGVEEIKTVQFLKTKTNYKIRLIDQRKLPFLLEYSDANNVDEAIIAISNMTVRGAPAIGVTGLYALILGAHDMDKIDLINLQELRDKIVRARPTAKDLESFIDLLLSRVNEDELDLETLRKLADEIVKDSEQECLEIGEQSKHLITEGMGILTHCNAGALATVDWGTALAPMRLAKRDGVSFKVFVDETRPRLQGMLTAWELQQEEIEHSIIADNAAGFFMQQGKIDLVITGTDRVLRDGTVTNKIGTFEKAVVAKTFGIPVFIAMPWSTYDPDTANAGDIPIEYRNGKEVSHVRTSTGYERVSPQDSELLNPAFDITAPEFITGYITRDGILSHNQLQKYYEKRYK
jgi:translation initiation factor eIF-2B subunit alpha/methylthioribose-1-phosphate isomerase